MTKSISIDTKFDFDRQIWWAYFDLESNIGNPKRFGIRKRYYKFRAKIDFENNNECRNYLLKRAQEYAKQFDDFSRMPEEKIMDLNDK